MISVACKIICVEDRSTLVIPHPRDLSYHEYARFHDLICLHILTDTNYYYHYDNYTYHNNTSGFTTGVVIYMLIH